MSCWGRPPFPTISILPGDPYRWPASTTRCGFIALSGSNDWLLYAFDSPSNFGGRGYSRGQIFTGDGSLIALGGAGRRHSPLESADVMKQPTRNKSVPDFVIAGAPKCGTTSLHHWLNQHPDLFMIRGEPHYFASDIDYNVPRMSAACYQALCAKADPDQRCGERSTWYMFSSTAAREIHAANPDARIILIVRQPADMLYSLHAHLYQRRQRENIASLAEAIRLESERRAGRCLPQQAGFPEKFRYSELPRYSEQIRRFRDQFGRDQIKVILFDDLRNDPDNVYSSILGFLQVSRDFQNLISRSTTARPRCAKPHCEKSGKPVPGAIGCASMTPRWIQDFTVEAASAATQSGGQPEALAPDSGRSESPTDPGVR